MNQQVLTNTFLSLCSPKNRSKVKQITFEGDRFFAISMGQIGAFGVNFDPFISPESENYEERKNPCLMVWEMMPDTTGRNLTLPKLMKITVGLSKDERPEICVSKEQSVFAEMHQFTRIVDEAKASLKGQLVRV